MKELIAAMLTPAALQVASADQPGVMGLAQGKRAFIAFVARQIEATLRGCSLTDDRVPTLKWGMRMIRSFAAIAGPILIATLGAAAANAQRLAPPGQSVTAYVVMTPNGPATCATWTQWRAPGANTTDKEGIQYWAEGYISGLAAGSRHDVLAQFQLRDLARSLLRNQSANQATAGVECARAGNAGASRRKAVMARKQVGGLMPLTVALALVLAVAGCASGPLGSHGVDYIPAFDTGPQGGGR